MTNENFLLKSFFALDQFSAVNRFAKNRAMKVENDLEHTGWVALWCYFISLDLKNKFNIKVNYENLLKGALSHDLDELLMGDVPRPLKYFNTSIRLNIQEIEKISIRELSNYLLDGSTQISSDWENAKEGYSYPTIEQYIVTIADFMSVVYKVWQEIIMFNNYSFSSVALEVLNGLYNLRNQNEKYLEFSKSKNNAADYLSIEFLNYFKEHLNSALELLEECINITKPISHLISPLIKIEND